MRDLLRRIGGVVLVSGVLFAGGCEHGSAPDSGEGVGWPVGASGMACQLLDYAAVLAALGTEFDTAGGASVESTYTCVFTRAGQDYPDLTLAVTATAADEVIFTATVTPSGAEPVTELGRVAYLLHRPPVETAGPGVEVGWLSMSGRLMMLRYTFEPEAPAAEVEAFGPKLVAFAQQVDAALVAGSS